MSNRIPIVLSMLLLYKDKVYRARASLTYTTGAFFGAL